MARAIPASLRQPLEAYAASLRARFGDLDALRKAERLLARDLDEEGIPL